MAVVRTHDIDLIAKAVSRYNKPVHGFNPEDWGEGSKNIALVDEIGNVSLFEYDKEGVVTGHYFFVSRGKEAVTVSSEMLYEIFHGPYRIEAIRGLTPIDHKGALWLSRHLGFKQYVILETEAGPCALFILTKNEYLNKENG